MRNFNRILSVLLLSLFVVVSCNKKVSPAFETKTEDSTYDISAYNWVYVEGIKQKLTGNSGDALKYLEQAIKINPKSDAAYYQMAQIVSANGDLINGKKFLKMALEIDRENIWYLMMIAGFYYQDKMLDSAIYYYEKATSFSPEEENLQLTLGNLYSENKNFDKAQNIFDTFDKKYGVNENSTVSSIKALMMDQKFDAALVKAELLIKDYPDEVLYNGILAEIYRGKGDNDKARMVYSQLMERNPDDPQIQISVCDFLISDKNYSELFVLLNSIILNSNVKREDKISLFARLIELPDLIKDHNDDLIISMMVLEANFRDDEIIPLLRPELLIKLSKLGEASSRLEEIIKVNPENYYAWEKLLLVYNQMGDFKTLMVKGEECATKFNRSFLAKILYANAAMENKEFAIALEELRKAEILAGDNKDFMAQVLTMRADAYYRMKDYVKAFETFETAIKSNQDDLTVINNYAYYLAEQNENLKEAEEMARKVIDKEKGNNTYLDTYGWVLYKRGKLNEAAKVMENIIESGEKPDAEWFEHYGFILKKQKKCMKAIDIWNIALKLDSTKVHLKQEIENCKK
jgi:Tfp pilus assembly protein PilF